MQISDRLFVVVDGPLEPVIPPVQRERSSEMERSLTNRMEAARQTTLAQSIAMWEQNQ